MNQPRGSLVDAEQRHDDREEGDALDQCGGQDHVGEDAAAHLGLASGALVGRGADATDAELQRFMDEALDDLMS
jgi:hypothetical protein